MFKNLNRYFFVPTKWHLVNFYYLKKNSYSYKNLAFVISQYKNQFFVLYAKR